MIDNNGGMASRAISTYDISSTNTELARQEGYVDAQWALPTISTADLRRLQRRSDIHATLSTSLWLGLMVMAGIAVVLTAWSWWSIPSVAVYSALYGGASDSRWHEMGHGTAFRSRRANDVIYYLACFMLFRGPTVWRWSHYRHHTDTIIKGHDAEIAFQRPPSIARTLWRFTHLQGGVELLLRLVRHAAGRLDDEVKELVPTHERRRVVRESRIMIGVLLIAVIAAVVMRTVIPVVLIGGSTFLGGWLVVFFGITQHAGLQENVLDHRLNTRTVMMNPVFRFLYLNMNFHVEHHMFPSVPYYSLPSLHHEIGNQLAPALPSTWAAYRQIFGTFRRQQADPNYEIPIELPEIQGDARPVEIGAESWMRGPSGEVILGLETAFTPGEIRRVDVGRQSVVVGRTESGSLFACEGWCTHAKVHLGEGAVIGDEIECPKHNARFDCRTGEATRKPAKDGLTTYPVTVSNGRVSVHLAGVDSVGP